MLSFQDVFLFCTVTFLVVWWKRKRVWSLAAKIPGFDGIPVLGVLYFFIGVKPEDLYTHGLAYVRAAASSFRVWAGPFLIFIPRDPEEVKILMNSESSFEKPSLLYKMFLDYGMLTTGGGEYKIQRKSVSPIFYPKSLQGLVSAVDVAAKNFIQEFDDANSASGEIEMSQHTLVFALQSILSTMFGLDDIPKEVRAKFLHDVDQYFKASSEKVYKWWLMIKPIHKLTGGYDVMMKHRAGILEFLDLLMSEIEKEYQEGVRESERREQKFLDHLYRIRHMMSYDDTRESVLALLSAGFDTTGKMLPSILLMLAMNPDVQEKLHEEISSFISADDDEISDEVLNNLTYLDLVIKETGRMMPAVLMYGRELTQDVELPKYTLPSGTVALFLPLPLHTDKQIWGEDADKFKPERFTLENFQKIHPSAYIFFSRGPRMCIGYKYAMMAMKVFIARFLLKYRVETSLKYEELIFETNFTMMIKQGFMTRAERRWNFQYSDLQGKTGRDGSMETDKIRSF